MSACLLACGGGGMTRTQLDDRTQEILDSDQAAYFVGEDANGHELAFIFYPDGERNATGPRFGYGTSCVGADCHEEVSVSTYSLSVDYLNAYGCDRLEPVLGVPAARYGGSLVLFTDDYMITITIFDDIDANLDDELALAHDLRAVGQPGSGAALPPPTATSTAIIDETCGAAPGVDPAG
jgi:hypothetical protein